MLNIEKKMIISTVFKQKLGHFQYQWLQLLPFFENFFLI